jgi:large subunit ribosomal protein L6
MSNLGMKEIKLPSNIKVCFDRNILNLESNFGKLSYIINDKFNLELTKHNSIKFYPKNKNKSINCFWGTQYSILKSSINGLSQGYTKTLKLVGVGFRAMLTNKTLILNLGYSHKVIYKIPYGIVVKCLKQNEISVFGLNKQLVNEIAAKIRLLKKIDPYKGKGILLKNTKLRLKEGKKK